MKQIRRDYLLDKYVIFSTARNKRPSDFCKEKKEVNTNSTDYFALGNEHLTPEEKGRVGEPWNIRWFENKFPAVDQNSKENLHLQTHNKFYTFSDAFGIHEVIVETNDDRQLWDLTDDEFNDLFGVYQNRLVELKKEKNIKYVQIFKNHGPSAGCSIKHSHSQVIAFNLIPPNVVMEEKAVENYLVSNDSDPYDAILEYEKNSEREIFQNDYFFVYCPYASSFPFEVKILPFENIKSLIELDDMKKKILAQTLRKVLLKLKEINVDYNFYIREGINYQRFYIDVLPRPNIWAGFEMSTGVIINPVLPEDAARFYKENK